MILYDVTLSYFSHRVSEVFTQVFIIPLDFFTGFFKDYIHSLRRSSTQWVVLQYKIM
jgi:hypothetical protein